MQNQFTQTREAEGRNTGKTSDYVGSTIKEEQEKIKNITADIEKSVKQGEEQLKKMVHNVDKQLHENPWPIMAGVAATSLLLGFILGQTKRHG